MKSREEGFWQAMEMFLRWYTSCLVRMARLTRACPHTENSTTVSQEPPDTARSILYLTIPAHLQILYSYAGYIRFLEPDERKLKGEESPPPDCCSIFCCVFCSLTVLGGCCVAMRSYLIRKGEVGVAQFYDGTARVLAPGWHLLDVFFATVKRFKATDNTIHHGNMHIIRVKPGEVGIGVLNGEPLILLPGGRHVITEPTFSFERRVALTEALINHSTLHIITVNRGK